MLLTAIVLLIARLITPEYKPTAALCAREKASARALFARRWNVAVLATLALYTRVKLIERTNAALCTTVLAVARMNATLRLLMLALPIDALITRACVNARFSTAE